VTLGLVYRTTTSQCFDLPKQKPQAALTLCCSQRHPELLSRELDVYCTQVLFCHHSPPPGTSLFVSYMLHGCSKVTRCRFCLQSKQQELTQQEQGLKSIEQALSHFQTQESKLQRTVSELQALQQTAVQRVSNGFINCMFNAVLHVCMHIVVLTTTAWSILRAC